jgi:hypothetical protein
MSDVKSKVIIDHRTDIQISSEATSSQRSVDFLKQKAEAVQLQERRENPYIWRLFKERKKYNANQFSKEFTSTLEPTSNKSQIRIKSITDETLLKSTFINRFDTENGDIFIETAQKNTPKEMVHLSEIIFQQHKVIAKKHSMPKTGKVVVEMISNESTVQAMKSTGSGIFEKGTKQFDLLQKTVLAKAIQYLHRDHQKIFSGRELIKITVNYTSHWPDRKIICEFGN